MKRRRVAVVSGTIFGLALAGVAVASCAARRGIDEIAERAREPYAKHSAAFFEDQAAIAAAAPFPLAGSERDAGPFLNPRISWYGKKPLVDAHAQKNASVALAKVPQPLLDRLATYRDKWTDHADDAELVAFDTSWMKGLDAFDHWDVDANGPAEDPTAYAWFERPEPSVHAFAPWSQVRLLQGLASGDARAAAREVRHVARLLHSTETREGALAAVRLLELERAAFEKQRAVRGEASVEGWNVVDAATSERLRRVARVHAALAALHAPGELTTKAFATKGPTWARCAALNEALVRAHWVRWYAEDDMRARYAELTAVLAATQGECRLTSLRKAWASQPTAYGAHGGARSEICQELGPDGAWSSPPICVGWIAMHVIPGARALTGHAMASAGAESFTPYANPLP